MYAPLPAAPQLDTHTHTHCIHMQSPMGLRGMDSVPGGEGQQEPSLAPLGTPVLPTPAPAWRGSCFLFLPPLLPPFLAPLKLSPAAKRNGRSLQLFWQNRLTALHFTLLLFSPLIPSSLLMVATSGKTVGKAVLPSTPGMPTSKLRLHGFWHSAQKCC